MGKVGAGVPILGAVFLSMAFNIVSVLDRIRHVAAGEFIRAVAKLVGGTAAAQLILFAATPVLTRLYSVQDFSVFGAFVAMMSVASIAGCLGYDNAIVAAEKDEDAVAILLLAISLSVLISAFCAVILLIESCFSMHLFDLLGSSKWAIPPVVFFASCFSAVQFWSSRRKQFTAIARVRVLQAVAAVTTQTGAGFAGLTPFGLIIGQAINFLVGVILLGRRTIHELRIQVEKFRVNALRSVAKRYQNFARMTAPALMANSAAVQVPVMIVAAVEKGAEAGFLFLAMRVMQAPLTTIGSAVSQVYYAEAPQAWRDGRLPELTHDVIKRLSQVGLGPLLFAGMVGKPLFEIIFGAGWGRAGEIVAWMVPWLMLQFLASPISMLLYAIERQRTDLILQVFGVVVRIGPVLGAAALAPAWLPEVFALTGAIFYMAYLLVLRREVGLSWPALAHAISSARWTVMAWAGLGLGALTILRFTGWASP